MSADGSGLGASLVHSSILLTQVSAVEVLEFAALPHVAVGALAVVEDRVGDLDGEARGSVEAIPA